MADTAYNNPCTAVDPPLNSQARRFCEPKGSVSATEAHFASAL